MKNSYSLAWRNKWEHSREKAEDVGDWKSALLGRKSALLGMFTGGLLCHVCPVLRVTWMRGKAGLSSSYWGVEPSSLGFCLQERLQLALEREMGKNWSQQRILQTPSTALPLRKSSGEFKGRLGCSQGRRLGLDESLMDGLRFNKKIPNCP